MTLEQRIINVAEKQNYYDSRELRAIALEVRKREDRIKRLEEELMDVKNKHSVLVADVALYEDRADRIKRLEEALEECDWAFTKFCPEHESRYGDAWEKVRDALNRPNPFKPYWQEAKP